MNPANSSAKPPEPALSGCALPSESGIPTCETSPVGRYRFVYQELRDIFRALRRRRLRGHRPADAGREDGNRKGYGSLPLSHAYLLTRAGGSDSRAESAAFVSCDARAKES